MDNKFLLLLAFDSLLVELDKEYEKLGEEQINLIEAKVYESYGLKVSSTKEDVKKINSLLIKDVRKYRDKLIEEI